MPPKLRPCSGEEVNIFIDGFDGDIQIEAGQMDGFSLSKHMNGPEMVLFAPVDC